MKYFDELMIHQIKSVFYSNFEVDYIISDLEEMISEVEEYIGNIKSIHSVKDANEYLSELEELVADYLDEYENHMNIVASSISEKESKWYTSLILSTYAINLIIPKKINISLIPYSTINSIKTFSSNIKKKVYNTIKNNLNTGVFWGYGGEQLVENINKPLDLIKKNIAIETQEMVQSFVKITQKQIQKSNYEIFTGYKWCSLLDSRTCDICVDLDGTIYKDISKIPFIPIHYKCRCCTIGFIQESIEPDWDSFEEWISNLDEEDQVDILGKKRFDLWKSGDINVIDFINDGRKIPLSDLYK